MLDTAGPPRRALAAYVGTVTVAGCALFLHCAARLSGQALPSEWWIFAALTFVTGRLTLKIPSLDARFTVSEVFAFTSVLLFGPEAGTVTLALDSLVLAWHRRMSLARAGFNFGNITLAVWISGTLFFGVSGAAPLFGHGGRAGELIAPLALFAGTYFALNTGLVAVVIGLETHASPLQIWRRHLSGLAAGYAASASVALLVVAALQQMSFAALAVLPPLLLLFYYTLQASFGRLEDAKGHLDKLNTLYLSTIETLATAIDAKDEVTHGHVRRVQRAAVALARELGVRDESTLKAIEAAALLHDTGKIAVPEHILNKPGRLTPAEFEKMKLHAPIGAEILSAIDFPYPVVPIVRHHHENWDGTGYPDRISGTDIPIGARILAVVDCFDALTSDRPYRKRLSDDEALGILQDRRGTMYDPLVVDAFAAAYKEIMPTDDGAAHPAARAIGGARTPAALPAPATEGQASAGPVADEVLAIGSLARAVSGEASAADVGALLWMAIRQIVPAHSMALFVEDERRDVLTVAYAGGAHAVTLRQVTRERGGGVAGWVAVNRRGILNADPALDLGPASASASPPLRAALTVPLVWGGRLAGVLSCYGAATFSEDHQRLIEIVAPTLAAALASATRSCQEAAGEGGGRRRPVRPNLVLVRP